MIADRSGRVIIGLIAGTHTHLQLPRPITDIPTARLSNMVIQMSLILFQQIGTRQVHRRGERSYWAASKPLKASLSLMRHLLCIVMREHGEPRNCLVDENARTLSTISSPKFHLRLLLMRSV